MPAAKLALLEKVSASSP